MTETVYISVGSNIDPEKNVPAALDFLKKTVKVTGISRCFRTEPIDGPEQNMYINCVWQVETEMTPDDLNEMLHEIENKLGRVRTEDKYAARTIDLDLLVYGTEVLDDDIETRSFLKAGLSDLDPDRFGFEGIDGLIVDCNITSILKERLNL